MYYNVSKTYPCRKCGEPIIFRFPHKEDDDKKNGGNGKPKTPRSSRKVIPIHINGSCGQRGFRFNN